MNNRSRLFLAVLLLALLAPAAYPQKRLCPKPPPSPFKHDAQISTSLDRRANAMRVTLQHPRALGKGTDLFYMAATFLYQDPHRPSNPTLDLLLIAASPLTKVNTGGGLSILCDGQPCTQTRHVGYMTGPGGAEAAKVTLSYAEASAITHARRVVARVGGSELEFTNNHLEALREMVNQLAPSPGLWTTAGNVSAR
jgi:hypothetical protein